MWLYPGHVLIETKQGHELVEGVLIICKMSQMLHISVGENIQNVV